MSEPAANEQSPVLTQQMTMHLNGGSEFSELRYDVYADGKPTGIKRRRRTSGSPEYFITDDVFWIGEEYFDVRETKGVGLRDWIFAHLKSEEGSR